MSESGPRKRPRLPPRGVAIITTAPASVIKAPIRLERAVRLGDARDSPVIFGEDARLSGSQRRRERHGSALIRRREQAEGFESVPGLRDRSDRSAAGCVDPLDAVLAIGPELDPVVARDHGQTMEPAPTVVGVGDRRDSGAVAGEDPADSVRRIRAEGNGACLVHRRADRRESTVGVSHYPQVPVPEEEHALLNCSPVIATTTNEASKRPYAL